MKKRGAFLITCSLMFILPLSSCNEDSVTTVSKPTLRIRTEKNQELKVGEGINIVYSTYNTDKGVTFTSSNEEVVTVNEFGEVSAVGVGEATITIALIEDSSISDTINFVVTKNFFKDENGFKNGVVDLSNQEENGAIYVNDGQAQVLADFPSTK